MTMPTPKGAFTCGEAAIIDKLLACDWFEKFTKETVESKRRARIYRDKVPETQDSDEEIIGFPELHELRPFVCMWPAQPAGRFASRIATGTVSVGLDYQIYFEADEGDAVFDEPTIDDRRDDELFAWWLNMMGVLLGGHHDDISPILGLIDQQNFALRNISGVDMWHSTHRESGLGNFFSAIATLETGAIPT